MGVNQSILFTENQLSPTIVEFSSCISCNWSIEEISKNIVAENAKDIISNSSLTLPDADNTNAERQSLLGDDTSLLPPIKLSTTSRAAQKAYSLLKETKQRVKTSMPIWLLFLRWYGLYSGFILLIFVLGTFHLDFLLLLLALAMIIHLVSLVRSAVKEGEAQ
jgi:hypothetical protein